MPQRLQGMAESHDMMVIIGVFLEIKGKEGPTVCSLANQGTQKVLHLSNLCNIEKEKEHPRR